jgi:hypothetical protein
MSEARLWTIHYSDPTEGIQGTGSVLLLEVAPNTYRMESATIFLSDIYYHDIIETIPRVDGSLEIVKVLERSKWKRYEAMVSLKTLVLLEDSGLYDEIIGEGGYWERPVMSFLYVFLPAESTLDVAARIRSLE